MLELRGASPGLLDDDLTLEVGGAPPGAALTWRARLRDDDGFVWRASGSRLDALAWAPAKASAGAVAALRSLRPVDVDVRVEDADGAGATRTLTRTLLAEGVKSRRWKGDVTGTLHLPAEPTGGGAIVAAEGEVSAVAAALLASRGVLVFVLAKGTPEAAREALAAVPSAPRDLVVLDAVPLPPGLPAREAAPGPQAAAAWDALLVELGARPRRVAR